MRRGLRAPNHSWRAGRTAAVLIPVLLVIGMLAAAYAAAFSVRSVQDTSDLLAATAESAAARVAMNWSATDGNARALAATAGYSERIGAIAGNGSGASELSFVQDRISTEVRFHNFDTVAVLAPDGSVLASAGPVAFERNPVLDEAVQRSLTTGQVAWTGFYRLESGSVWADWTVPSRPSSGGVVGVTVMRVDAERVWFADLNGWLSVTRTGEVVAFSTATGSPVSLTDPAVHGSSSLDELPFIRVGEWPDTAFESELADGTRVHAAVAAIPGADAGIAAVIDRDEVREPIVRNNWLTAGISALVLAVLLLIGRLQLAASRIVTAAEREEELERLVAQRTLELERTVNDLAEASGHKDRFLASMSHDLRTPLNAIIGFSSLLSSGMAGPLNDEQQRQTVMIQSAGHQLLTLVDDVLDLSRINAGRMDLTIEETSVQELVGSVLDLLSGTAAEAGLTLEARLPEEPLLLTTDRARVGQILVNLVGNAIKFTAEGGITVTAGRVEDGVFITVADTGCGIPAEDLALVTDEFRRSRTAGTREGSGLGLAISSRLAALLGGTLSIESELGIGTSVTLEVPREVPFER